MSNRQLRLLRRAYLACRPLAEVSKLLDGFNEDETPSEFDIVSEVLQNPISKNYPPHKEYRLAVTKLLISFLEMRTELGDYLYDELAAIMADSSGNVSFFNYEIGDQELECITLMENRAFVTEGSTGFRSWPAAKILAEVLLKENLEGRRILELGAGVGLTGLFVLKKRPNVASYTFTDCHAGVLDTLKQNLNLNFDSKAISKADVQLLDWCVGGTIEADLVVGADIVFDREIVPALVELIVGAVRSNSCDVIISSVIRNEDTYAAFYDSVSQQLDCEKLRVKNLKYFEKIPDHYEVLKLSKKRDTS